MGRNNQPRILRRSAGEAFARPKLIAKEVKATPDRVETLITVIKPKGPARFFTIVTTRKRLTTPTKANTGASLRLKDGLIRFFTGGALRLSAHPAVASNRLKISWRSDRQIFRGV